MSRTVAKNALWNVGGQLASLSVGLVALPLLLHELGAARLGVFTLALGLIGFSGLFDLGLGRALTQTVSSSLGQGRSQGEVAALVSHVIGLLAAVGTLWTVALWWAAPFLVDRLFSLTGEMARETAFGLRALALSIPFALAATGAMGTLEGLQQFRLLSLWRMPMSVLQFGLPLGVAIIRPDVGWVIAALAVTRVVWMLLWLTQLNRLLPRVPGTSTSRADLRHALHFGGWLSVSNLIGPLMVYADRFYLASVFPPAMVAYYTVPFDTAFRATSLPQTAVNALFPALAETQSRPEASTRLLALAIRAVVVLMLPAVLVVAVFAHPLLALWLNTSFAAPATPVLKLLLVGIFLNSAAHLPYALLQAHGRSDLTAKLHSLELPVFALLLVVGVHLFGIAGAALAWSLRVLLDTALLFAMAWRLHPPQRTVLAHGAGLLCSATGALLLAIYAVHGPIQIALTVIITVVCAFAALHTLRLTRLGTHKGIRT
jgi:O-antigen/teichoic acid export membrane protein